MGDQITSSGPSRRCGICKCLFFIRIWQQPKSSPFVSCLMFLSCCLIGCDPVKPSAAFSTLTKWSHGHPKCRKLPFSYVPTCIFTFEMKSFSALFGWKDRKTGGRLENGPLKNTLKFSADLDQGVRNVNLWRLLGWVCVLLSVRGVFSFSKWP